VPTSEESLPGDAASDVVPGISATGQAQAEEAGEESEQSPSTSEDDVEEDAFSLEEDPWDVGSAMGPAPDPDAHSHANAHARSIVRDIEYGSPGDAQARVTDMETLIKVCLVAQDRGLMDGSPPSRVRKQIQDWATKLLPDYIPGINADPLTPEAELKQWLPAVELNRFSAVQLEKLLPVAGLSNNCSPPVRNVPCRMSTLTLCSRGPGFAGEPACTLSMSK
jgi:hypothetical protein